MERRQEKSFYASSVAVAVVAAGALSSVRPSDLAGGQCRGSRVENWSSGPDVAGKADKYGVREGTLGNCTVRRGRALL
uniref:Uncharacterized protein n=1 Tax=Triticum urartu TaxID=4572 RepID=A0A8R7P4T4_TRIUA